MRLDHIFRFKFTVVWLMRFDCIFRNKLKVVWLMRFCRIFRYMYKFKVVWLMRFYCVFSYKFKVAWLMRFYCVFRYKFKEFVREERALNKAMKARVVALEELKKESEELYQQAIQVYELCPLFRIGTCWKNTFEEFSHFICLHNKRAKIVFLYPQTS